MKNSFQPKVMLTIDEGGYPFTEEQRAEVKKLAQSFLEEQAKKIKAKIKCTCTIEIEYTSIRREKTSV